MAHSTPGGFSVTQMLVAGATSGVLGAMLGNQQEFSVTEMLVAGGVQGVLGAMFQNTCMTRDMPRFTADGEMTFGEVRVGQTIGCCDENDPHGPMVFKTILEVFEGWAEIWVIIANGRKIRTTAEHPFYVWGKGWVQCNMLQRGDLLRSHNGRTVIVDDVYDSGVQEQVYNCRVEDYHTYFVGCADWGFSVWAHNACKGDGDFKSRDALRSHNKVVQSLSKEYGLSKAQQRQLHDEITGQGFSREEIRGIIEALFGKKK